MDFSVSDTTRGLVDRVRRFVEDELVSREPSLLGTAFYAAEPELRALRAEVQRLGLWAPQLPKEIGGLGLSLVDHALVSEVLGRTPYGHYVFGCQAPDAGNLEILHRHATPEQRERYLVPLSRGEVRSCFAMTEPDTPGSNPTQLACRAARAGGEYVIDGRKWFTSSADGAAFAVVMAVTDPGAEPHRRASLLVVPADTPGFVRVRNISVMGDPGEGWASHAELRFEGCRVPASSLLGAEGHGFAIAQERLGPGRIHHCMRWMGICERAFDLMCARAASRRIEAEDTLAGKQLVQAWIAESRVRIAAARLLILEAAWKMDTEGHAAAQEQISLVKFFAADVLMEVLDRAIQVHGALGITDDTPLAGWWAHERAARIYDGPDEVHKVAAARRILKRYGAR